MYRIVNALVLTMYSNICYHRVMTKSKPTYELTSVSFRLAPEQVRQLSLLGAFYGGRTRALLVSLDRLYQSTLAENPAFAELVAAGTQPPADAAEPVE
jgi:hypothetical protein